MAPWAQQILDAANEHYDRAEYSLAQPYYEKLVHRVLWTIQVEVRPSKRSVKVGDLATAIGVVR